MFKTLIIFLAFIFFTNCSVDTKSGFWQKKDGKLESSNITSLSFEKKLTFNEFKKNVIMYGKKSKYPRYMD